MKEKIMLFVSTNLSWPGYREYTSTLNQEEQKFIAKAYYVKGNTGLIGIVNEDKIQNVKGYIRLDLKDDAGYLFYVGSEDPTDPSIVTWEYYIDNSNNMQPPQVPNCPQGSNWNGSSCTCTAPQYWDPSTNSCVTCSSPRTLVSGSCICTGGRTWNGSSCTCSGSGQYWDSGAFSCRTCSSPRTLVSGSCICAGGGIWNGSSCDCPSGKYWDLSALSCATCSSPRTLASGSCVCPGNGTWNATTSTCSCASGKIINGYCLCDGGGTWNATTSVCSCPTGKYLDRVTLSCTTCSSPRIIVRGSCICPSNRTWNATTSTCICPSGKLVDGYCMCGDGVWNATTSTCSCPTGKYWELSTLRCTTCSRPRTIVSGSCVCAGGGTWDDSTFTCSCPTGKYWDPSTNSCATCSRPRTIVSGSCVCDGGGTWNATTSTCSCPTGTYWNVSSCTTCPETSVCGFAVLGGGCTGNNPILVNGTCYNCTGIWLYNHNLISYCNPCGYNANYNKTLVFNNNWHDGQPACVIDDKSALRNTDARSWPQ